MDRTELSEVDGRGRRRRAAAPREHRDGRSREAGGDPARPRGADQRRPRPVRGRPGTAKTVLARAIAGSIEGAVPSRIQCTPDLQPTDVTGLSVFDQRAAAVRVPAGPAVRERPAGRRDQPRDAEDAVGAARGDGRATGDGRRRHARPPRAVLPDGDREPDRVRGHVPAARGAARPVRGPHEPRLPGRGGGAADRARAAARPPARGARGGRSRSTS